MEFLKGYELSPMGGIECNNILDSLSFQYRSSIMNDPFTDWMNGLFVLNSQTEEINKKASEAVKANPVQPLDQNIYQEKLSKYLNMDSVPKDIEGSGKVIQNRHMKHIKW